MQTEQDSVCTAFLKQFSYPDKQEIYAKASS